MPTQSQASPTYRGRFAPSPTGPLHFGSLVAGLASFLDARHHQGQWYVRIEDLDPPREQAGAADAILRTLEIFRLHWDGPILRQSQRHELYESICQQLLSAHKAYYCTCSRSQLASFNGIYPGTCQHNLKSPDATPPNKPYAVRFQSCPKPIMVKDAIQGHFEQSVAKTVGDFVIKRKDGLYAYQLAVVIDDHEQQINHVVRGIDLLDNTPRQILLQQALGFATPEYAHLPVIVNQHGQKLSKQTLAPSLPTDKPTPMLVAALRVLGHPPPSDLLEASIDDLLHWAIEHWSINNIPKRPAIEFPFKSDHHG